ncbi:MAG TPA: hypothetical protein VGJ60_27930 [Chloroflexota bacterium]|jgi:hypothetical protein
MWKLAFCLAVAMSLMPVTVAATALSQPLPEIAIPESALGADWQVASVNGPEGPHALYEIHLARPGQNMFAVLVVGQAQDGAEAQSFVEDEKADLQKDGADMVPVEGPGDGTAYRGIAKTRAVTVDSSLSAVSDVQVTIVKYVGRANARVTKVITGGFDTPEQTLLALNARLYSMQVARFRAVTPVPQPTRAPTPVPTVTAQTFDARGLVLTPADLGSNWALTLASGDAESFTAEYFNNTVDYTGFTLDQLTVEPMSSETAADARVQQWQSIWMDQGVVVRAVDGLGDGHAVCGWKQTDVGLATVSLAYRVGQVEVVARAEAASPGGGASIESEAFRIAHLETDHVHHILTTGNVPAPVASLTPSSALDPAPIALPVELVGEGWSILHVDDRGSSEQTPWVHSVIYQNDTTFPAPRIGGIWILVLPDAPRARLWIGINIAGGVAAGVRYQPVAGLGDETANRGVLAGTDGQTTVEYLYRVGPVMVRVAVRGADASVDELSQQAWDLAVAQQQRVLDKVTLTSSVLAAR